MVDDLFEQFFSMVGRWKPLQLSFLGNQKVLDKYCAGTRLLTIETPLSKSETPNRLEISGRPNQNQKG